MLCFWSVKQKREAADIDPEPNLIAWELSEATQNASGKVIFKNVFPSHFLTWHLCPTGIHTLESCWCPDCVYKGSNVFLLNRTPEKFSQVTHSAVQAYSHLSMHCKRWVTFRAHLSKNNKKNTVLISASLNITYVLNYTSFQYKIKFHEIIKNTITFYPLDHRGNQCIQVWKLIPELWKIIATN